MIVGILSKYMSRTKRGEKGPGWDRWSREANSRSNGKIYDHPGKWSKKQLAKRARRNAKKIGDDSNE